MKELEKLIKFLREQATAMAAKDAKAAEGWNAMASELEHAKLTEDNTAAISAAVEETIAARIKSGDLVVKAEHAKAVADAEKAGNEKANKAIEEKAAAEKKTVDTIASRNKAVADAGLDLKFPLLKDKTIEQIVASIPATDEGNAKFEEQLEAWKNLSKKTGQAQATASAASAGKVVPPMGGGAADSKKKPGWAFI